MPDYCEFTKDVIMESKQGEGDENPQKAMRKNPKGLLSFDVARLRLLHQAAEIGHTVVSDANPVHRAGFHSPPPFLMLPPLSRSDRRGPLLNIHSQV